MEKLKSVIKFVSYSVLLITLLLSTFAFKLQENKKSIISFDILTNFTASGWMGDGELGEKHINLFEVWEDNTRPENMGYVHLSR